MNKIDDNSQEYPQEENIQETVEIQEEYEISDYKFKSKKLLNEHYDKHGKDMGFESAEDYVLAANKVISNPKSLHKIEAEDGDDVYYLEETNEFVILSTEGYIRTYFYPDAGIDYFNRQ
ncbi:MAG: hypothetical protein Q4E33_01520 [Erysipelotrichaceae bacterium]|nr:hypothetical protein [Erysipelotrichaceae bacterium]